MIVQLHLCASTVYRTYAEFLADFVSWSRIVMYPRLTKCELLDAEPLPSIEEFEKKTFYGDTVEDLPKHYYYHRWWQQADRFLEKGQ